MLHLIIQINISFEKVFFYGLSGNTKCIKQKRRSNPRPIFSRTAMPQYSAFLLVKNYIKKICILLDTDFICWKSISNLLDGPDTAAIHREDIMPSIYPDQTAFTKTEGFPLDSFDWTVQPFNTALAYFGNDEFRRYYTDTAIRFMRCSPDADDTLTYMVFAEQRLLAMCAEKKHAHAAALSDLPALFGGAQNGYFTHIWGFKQQMRENPELYEDFCRRCAARLQKDFPEESKTIANIAELSPFFA